MMTIDRRAVVGGMAAISAMAACGRAAAQSDQGRYLLDPLPFPTNALEPHIDARTMELHHGKHHAAYVNNLNAVLKDHPKIAEMPLDQMLARLGELPESIRTVVRNNGGGHVNHTMFWRIMGKDGGSLDGDLKAAIDRDLGGVEKLQNDFNAAGSRIFGSGWVFVTIAPDGKLSITTKPNQDTPLMDGGRVLMGNDVWEHAYYLTYQNRRADYLKAWWNVLDWKKVEDRYARAKAGKLTI